MVGPSKPYKVNVLICVANGLGPIREATARERIVIITAIELTTGNTITFDLISWSAPLSSCLQVMHGIGQKKR